MSDRNKKWEFSNLHELHAAANALLRQAILNERYKRWRKVVDLYRELLWLISLDKLPTEYEPPSSYTMLLYELHFHLGVAYQHLNEHKRAIKHFSKTIEVVSIAKNGCLAGCLTNSCLMTPIYARRAFAHAHLGSFRLALKDAEKAVVLDSKSPDVYCIRALVHSTFDDELVGLKDLDRALEINKDHVCAIMLKASFTKPLAVRLCEETETYLTCNSFTHPCIIEFYDKFLFPLSVPHTITVINLTPEKPSKKQLESNYSKPVEPQSRPLSAISQNSGSSGGGGGVTEVFRCGTAKGHGCNRVSWKRRMDYSDAVRQHMARPKSASEFFQQLEKHRRQEAVKKRAQSCLVRPGQRFARPTSTTAGSDLTRPTSTAGSSSAARPVTAPYSRTETKCNSAQTRPQTACMSSTPAQDYPDARSRNDSSKENILKPTPMKKFEIETPSNYSMPVFQTVNIKFAPRMYYRPWIGDKLPVSERAQVNFAPKFY